MSKIVCDTLEAEVNRENISKMVRTFYKMIMKDQTVNPYFIMALGNDLENEEWQEHYKILEDFWMMLMTGEKVYTRDAFAPHLDLAEMYEETFEAWLKLFDEVVHLYYTPKLAQKFYKRAEVLSRKFMQWLDIEQESID
ncbi:MAG: group III truncated hemoglobin [Sulfurovum sp.]|nr:group III truncated hemoglobin [Sulfurovum sp.]